MKKYYKRHKLDFIWTGFVSILFAGVYVLLSIAIQMVIDSAIEGNIMKSIWISIGYLALFTLVGELQAIAVIRLNVKILNEIREDIVRSVLDKNQNEFKKYKESDYISLIQNDVKKIEDTYITNLYYCIQFVAQLTFAIVVMTYYSYIFTIVMLGMTILMFLIPALVSKKLEKGTKEVSLAQERLTEGVSEVVYGYEVTKSFHKEEYRLSIFNVLNLALKRRTKRLEMLKQTNTNLSYLLGLGMQIVISILAGYFIYQKTLSAGSMVGVINVSGSITNPLANLFTLVPVLKALKPLWQKIKEYTSNEEKKEMKMKDSWEIIKLEDVSFSYNDKDYVLEHINLTITKDNKYLIVGESGSGKTTLTNILSGKLIPSSGHIYVDDIDITGSPEVLRDLTAGVWQNTYLFNESIKDNIELGIEDNNLLKVANKASLNEVIQDKGFDFVVGNNGNQLSGGQKQRIAIARALYAKKDILILDEGLSALDEKMGKDIEESLLNDNKQTIISISHHILDETKALYDKVIEVKNGHIIYA